jgi:hypothetical protein
MVLLRRGVGTSVVLCCLFVGLRLVSIFIGGLVGSMGDFGEGGGRYSIAVVPVILMLSVPVTLMFPGITITKDLMSYFDAVTKVKDFAFLLRFAS